MADADLQSAEFIQQMNPTPISVVCYHCEQAAEKYLKGFMAYSDMPINKTHDLDSLCKLCENVIPKFNEISDSCIRLSVYTTTTRYPNELQLEDADMQIALHDAKSVIDFVKEVISKTERNLNNSDADEGNPETIMTDNN